VLAVIADPRAATRLTHLSRIVERELRHLKATDGRLFFEPFSEMTAARLEQDEALAERVEAFVSRFGRLQDTLGDKLLPAWLAVHGERVASFVDNLDRAEKLALIDNVQDWIDMCKLRNQMVHEYVDDPLVLASALQAAHRFVPTLEQVAGRLTAGFVSEDQYPRAPQS
jgi:hypothetical protein